MPKLPRFAKVSKVRKRPSSITECYISMHIHNIPMNQRRTNGRTRTTME